MCAEENGGEGAPAREAELQAAAQEARERGRYIDRFRRGFPGLTAVGPRPAAAPLRLPPCSNVTPSPPSSAFRERHPVPHLQPVSFTSIVNFASAISSPSRKSFCNVLAWPLLRFSA